MCLHVRKAKRGAEQSIVPFVHTCCHYNRCHRKHKLATVGLLLVALESSTEIAHSTITPQVVHLYFLTSHLRFFVPNLHFLHCFRLQVLVMRSEVDDIRVIKSRLIYLHCVHQEKPRTSEKLPFN